MTILEIGVRNYPDDLPILRLEYTPDKLSKKYTLSFALWSFWSKCISDRSEVTHSNPTDRIPSLVE